MNTNLVYKEVDMMKRFLKTVLVFPAELIVATAAAIVSAPYVGYKTARSSVK